MKTLCLSVGRRAPVLALVVTLLACAATTPPVRNDAASAPAAGRDPQFDWFVYEGHDSVFTTVSPGPDDYLNPILEGFYPDPSVTRVGDDFYLVTSTFAYFPGIPVFHSRDLVSWTQIGNVIDRPTQLSFDGLGMSRGVFAPTIQEHAGTFYVLNTCVDCGGNYVVTAKDPAGPWSDPVWLRGIGGIDPSLFFDDDGRTYILNNDAPEGAPLYEGHRAIWIQELDLAALRPVGPRQVLVNGGVDIATKPIWIEGPHLFKHEGRYYLSAAEGGTAEGHSQVIFRADEVRGPYTPFAGNPILTQRTLGPNRAFPVTSAGHTELVQTPGGEWWATFLAVRPYYDDLYNTGRETFLLPVRWQDGWPFITTEPIPYVHARPGLPRQPAPPLPTSGNFRVREEFDGPRLAPYWLMIRTPREPFVDLTSSPGWLTLRARPVELSALGQPSFIGRRQQHQHATAYTVMRYAPAKAGDKAGIVAFQNDEHYYLLHIALSRGRRVVRLEVHAGKARAAGGEVVAETPLPTRTNGPVFLKIEARGGRYDFFYAVQPNGWIGLVRDGDGAILSTKVAGGFVGATFGLFAYAAP